MALPASNGKTVLVTGINGYIASVLGHLLLTKGYSIRGTSRRSASSAPLLEGPYKPYKERVALYEVPDMTADGAFDEAAKGVHGIFHLASPVGIGEQTYEAVVIPAVRGTETLLEAALKAGPQLESVVVTSSVAAVSNPTLPPGYVLTEADFATVSLERAIRERGGEEETPPGVLYGASKTAAEQTVWKFKKEQNPSFAITTVHPGVVYGPPLVIPASGPQLNMTLLILWKVLSGSGPSFPPPIGSGSFVDVRDVASIHLWAYENSAKANGERYIVTASCGPPQAVADIMRKKHEGTELGKKIMVGISGNGYVGYNAETGEVGDVEYRPEAVRPSSKKVQEATGIKWIPFKQSLDDTLEALRPLL